MFIRDLKTIVIIFVSVIFSPIRDTFASSYCSGRDELTMEPGNAKVAEEYSSDVIQNLHRSYQVTNIGKFSFVAQYQWSPSKFTYWQDLDNITIALDETKTVEHLGRKFYKTRLRMVNDHASKPAYVYYKCSDLTLSAIEFDVPYWNGIFKSLLAAGLDKIPYVESVTNAFADAFWPASKPSVWKSIEYELVEFLPQRHYQIVKGLLHGRLNQYAREIPTLVNQTASAARYMSVARSLSDFEREFVLGNDEADYRLTNYQLLPLFAALVTMKTTFYAMGTKCADKMTLSKDDVDELKNYLNSTVAYAKGYIERKLEYAMDKGTEGNLYNSIMEARSFVGDNALEFVPLWQNLASSAGNDGGFVYNPVVTYSNYLGRSTQKLMAEAIRSREPLTPKMLTSTGKRNKLVRMYGYETPIDGTPMFSGLELHFEDGATHTLGVPVEAVRLIEVGDKNRTIQKLSVQGYKKVDRVIFHFSDDKKVTLGTSWEVSKAYEFYKKDHYIASIFATYDANLTFTQAANIAVSYLPKTPNAEQYHKIRC